MSQAQEETLSKRLYIEAIEELCAIVESGDLEQLPHKLNAVEKSTGDSKRALLNKSVKEQLDWRRQFEPDTERYRLATNNIYTIYTISITNGLDILNAMAKSVKEGSPHCNDVLDKMSLQDVFGKAAQTCLKAMKFSQEYDALMRSISYHFTKNIEESGSLKKLYEWQRMPITARQTLITDVINNDFIKSIRDAEEELFFIPKVKVEFCELKDAVGDYRTCHIRISDQVMTDNTPYRALIVAAHEGGHHVDEFLRALKPEKYLSDVLLLVLSDLIRVKTSKEVFKKYIYESALDEKFDFDDMAVQNSLEKIKAEHTVRAVGEVGVRIANAAKAVALSVHHCFFR